MLTAKLMDQGVSLAVNGDRLTVETAAPLTDEQRNYIRSHKPQLMTELKAVAANDEASVVTRLEKIAKELHHPLSDLLNWYKDDLDDLATMSDMDFQFVVTEYLDNLDRYKPANSPHCVRCIDCKHFTRTDHPHIGACAAGAHQTAICGFWDTHLRGCDEFTEAGQPAGVV